MKRVLLAILVVLCMIVLTGCNSIDYGTVIEKSFSPAHKTYAPIMMFVGKTFMTVPRWIHYSNKWRILIENEDGREWWEVSESYFNSVEIGDAVDRRNE